MVHHLSWQSAFHQTQNAAVLIFIIYRGYAILKSLHSPLITVAFKQVDKIVSIYN